MPINVDYITPFESPPSDENRLAVLESLYDKIMLIMAGLTTSEEWAASVQYQQDLENSLATGITTAEESLKNIRSTYTSANQDFLGLEQKNQSFDVSYNTLTTVNHGLGRLPIIGIEVNGTQVAAPSGIHISTNRFQVTVPSGIGTIIYL